MKIYMIPVKPQEAPSKPNPFMPHSVGFNIETEFPRYLHRSKLITTDPDKADWHYLPIMWSFWQLSNDYGRINRDQMQAYLNSVIIDDKKTFTISEADNEPGFEMGDSVVFSGNQSVGYKGHKWIPVPIITLPHKVPEELPLKEFLSNFVGNTRIWDVRVKMVSLLGNRDDMAIVHSSKGEELFVNTILRSYSTLCPRGSALGSYRFYESMQMGVAPIMISDEDFRPFPNKIRWNDCSYFVESVMDLPPLLDSLSKSELIQKGEMAEDVWKTLFDKWPEYVLDELNANHT